MPLVGEFPSLPGIPQDYVQLVAVVVVHACVHQVPAIGLLEGEPRADRLQERSGVRLHRARSPLMVSSADWMHLVSTE